MMKFTQMQECHVAQVAELERMCFSTPWSEKSIATELQNDLALWMVALHDDTVVGYVGSQTVCGETDMMNVAVHPDWRRRGIGEILVEQLIVELKRRCSSSLSLEVRSSNAPAIALYEKLGFCQVGRRPNYYRNPKEDALILRKEWEV
ncbi:MAG: ribosomal protein S18-alanine N-acetyltransferase [Oscillospiraceae bacterium]|nr:ribosomal protein S18-alanine N-acetyltransferase [Oscillospiraceae bacterium]